MVLIIRIIDVKNNSSCSSDEVASVSDEVVFL